MASLRQQLTLSGAETQTHYPIPPHLQNAYLDLGYAAGSLPVSERLHREVLSLPMSPVLSHSQVQQVAEAVHRAARQRGRIGAGSSPP